MIPTNTKFNISKLQNIIKTNAVIPKCDFNSCKNQIMFAILAAVMVYVIFYVVLYVYLLYYTYKYNSNDLYSWKEDHMYDIKQNEMSKLNTLDTTPISDN